MARRPPYTTALADERLPCRCERSPTPTDRRFDRVLLLRLWLSVTSTSRDGPSNRRVDVIGFTNAGALT